MYTDIAGFNLILYVFFFLTGLTFGSFANVCIYRIPLDLSIIRPRSSCTKCKKQIVWHDNIPLLSYIMLGGKCRYCKEKISLIYPAVELITGVSFVVLFHFYGFTVSLFLFCFLSFCLIVISGIDFYCRIIPDIFPLMLAAAGILFSFFNETLGSSYLQRVLNSLIGLFVGGGFLLLIGVLGQFMFKKEAMGGGDVKLMAGVGAIIGWEKVLLAIFIASFLGSVVGIFLLLFKKIERRGYLPFGPFLAAASYMTLLLPALSILLNAFFAWETNLIHKIFGA